MKKFFTSSRNFIVNFVLFISLLGLVTYLVTSMNTVTIWYGKYTSLNEKYTILKLQERDLETQISKYKIKVEGIKQDTLDKTILENQVRERLGIYSRNEIILAK